MLLAATVASLAATAARNAFGVTWLWPAFWDNTYNLTEFLAAAACLLRAATAPPRERLAWGALAAGVLGYALGDGYWTVALADRAEQPYPSLADAGYISIYPACYAALVGLLRARAGRVPVMLWLDGMIAALSVAAVIAAITFHVVASTEGSVAVVATNLAYPLGDLSIIAVLIAILTITGRRAGATWWLAGLGFAVFAVADTIYLVQTAQGTYREFTLLDTIWPAAFTLIAFAAWQPARRLGPRHRHSSAMLAPPAVLALVALGLLLVDHYARLNELALSLAAASISAVVLRFALTFRENLRVLRAREAEAVTDQLTGLGNRRALLRDLERAADHEPGSPWVLALFDLDGFKAYNDAYGHPAGDSLLERLGANLAAAVGPQGQAYRMGGDEFCVLAPLSGADPSDIIMQAAEALSERGERFGISCSSGMALLPAEGTEPSQLLSLADQRMYADKREGRPGGDETVGRVLMHLLGERDDALHDHVGDVADLAARVGERLELPPAEIRHLRWAAALHDIGKVAIPDAILHAPRPLEPAEWDYIRRHTVIGARIIGAAPGLEPVAAIVRASHERWDGRGYPDGLAGTAIPLGARIVAVCDAYDAMTAERPYRTALDPQEGLAELRRCAGGQFDPAVVRAFEAIVAQAAAAA